MTNDVMHLARRGYEAVLRGDLDAVRELLDPDVKWHAGDPTAAGACRNREQTLEFMRRALTRAELVDLIDAGDKVVVILGRRSDPSQPPELVANLTTFRDGKVVEMVHYPNPDDARAAAGV